MRHLLIDEYQDTNTSQDALVKLLGEGADSLCAVGDEDQSIYRWRGAEVEHILRFDEDFPAARVVPLERNYRSTAKILEAASAVVSHNRRRRPKRLRADRGEGSRVRLWRFDEDRSEAEAVAREIGSAGRAPSESRDPLPHQRAVPAVRRGARPAADPLRRRRRHEVLRARRGQGRARVPAARRASRGRSRLSPRRQRSGPGNRRRHPRPHLRGGLRERTVLVGGLGGSSRADRPRADGARALPDSHWRAAWKGRVLLAVRDARAPARRERLRGTLRGLGGAARTSRGARTSRSSSAPRASSSGATPKAPRSRSTSTRCRSRPTPTPFRRAAARSRSRRSTRRRASSSRPCTSSGSKRVTCRTATRATTPRSSRRSAGSSTSG